MGKKVIADEHCKHNKVVDDALEVVVEREQAPYFPKLEIQVFAQERKVQKVKIDRLQPSVSHNQLSTNRNAAAGTDVPATILLFRRRPEFNLFAKQTKMRVVAQQAKHNEVRIKAI